MSELYAVENVNPSTNSVTCVFKTARGDYQYTQYADGYFKPLPDEDPMESYPVSEQREMRLKTAIAYAQTFLEKPKVEK